MYEAVYVCVCVRARVHALCVASLSLQRKEIGGKVEERRGVRPLTVQSATDPSFLRPRFRLLLSSRIAQSCLLDQAALGLHLDLAAALQTPLFILQQLRIHLLFGALNQLVSDSFSLSLSLSLSHTHTHTRTHTHTHTRTYTPPMFGRMVCGLRLVAEVEDLRVLLRGMAAAKHRRRKAKARERWRAAAA